MFFIRSQILYIVRTDKAISCVSQGVKVDILKLLRARDRVSSSLHDRRPLACLFSCPIFCYVRAQNFWGSMGSIFGFHVTS